MRVSNTRARESSTQPQISIPTSSDLQLLVAAGVPAKAVPRLLCELGGIAGVVMASEAELKRHGVAPASAKRLAAAFALARHIVLPRSPAINLPEHVFHACAPRLAGLGQEVFIVVSLDIRNGLVDISEVARGSVHGVEVHPREIFRTAIRHAAAGVILVHNHPSGDPDPSDEDIDLTRRLRLVGEMVGIPVVDHVIIAGARHQSIKKWRGSIFE
jgi:DNA repair protein RadC